MQVKRAKRIVLHGQFPGSAGVECPAPLLAAAPHIYILSPAHAGGKRAQMLFNASAKFELAQRLRTSGVTLGEAFSFMSPLYFRAKLLYAATFANAPANLPACLIITPCRGLLPPETVVRLDDLWEISDQRVHLENPKYRDPLERDLRKLSAVIGPQARVILLGSIATRKYIPLLLEALGDRVAIPREFISLGNMSRGALLLRCSREKRQLTYIPTAEALPSSR
jgi:hypothetical protein